MSTRRIDILIAAGFAVLLLANIAHHEMWRDETLAWMIVRTAHSPAGLFAALHYDGHPGLWHLLLWPATWVTTDPVAIKVVHAPIGLAIIGLVALASPFSRLERVLILGGYYLGFEYLVISRNYAIGILLALLHAQARVRAPDKVLLNSALLALMANTNVYAAIFSGVLALDYARERVVVLDHRGVR